MWEKITKYLIFLTIIFCPLYVIRWHYGFLPTNLLEHFVVLSGIFWFIWRIKIGDFSLPKTRINHLILPLFLFIFLSILISPDKKGALGIAKAYFAEPILFFFICIDLKQRKIINFREIVFSLILSGFWLSLLAIFQQFSDLFVVAPWESLAGRSTGFFNSGNSLALFLGPLIAILPGFQLISDQKKDKPLRLVLFVILFLAFWFSQSEGGLISLGCVLIFYFGVKIFSLEKIRIFFRIGILTYLVSQIIFMTFLVPRLAPETDNPWVRTGGTMEIRYCLWEGTVNLLQDHFFLGAGLSGFKETYSSHYITCDAEPLEYPHHLWLSYWSELGLGGFFIFILLWLGLWTQELFEKEEKEKINWSFLAMSLYWLIHGLVDVPYFKNDLSLLFWILMVLSYGNEISKNCNSK